MGTTGTRRHVLFGGGGVQRLLAAVRRRGRPGNELPQAPVRSWERSRSSRPNTFARAGAATVLAVGALAGATATTGTARAATSGPCDLYAAGGTPCVAAHSTTRALYASYNGPLYQVRRVSDNTPRDVGVLSASGSADAAAQDSFCAGTTCLISIIYDQSGRGNHLTQAPPGGFSGPDVNGYDNLAGATAAPVTVGGHKAYGVFVSPGTGYRNNHT